tara:strand:- start:3433 stop:3657 length:225 start_codon:yes stop_codon:yes gene_type:complete
MIEILGWIATGFLLIGYFLNAKKHIVSWLLWIIGNSLMFGYAILIQSYSVAFLSIVLIIINIYGYYSWRKDTNE